VIGRTLGHYQIAGKLDRELDRELVEHLLDGLRKAGLDAV
jgi:hypothetical protein